MQHGGKEMSTSVPPRFPQRVLAQKEENDLPQTALLPRFPPEIMHEILRCILIHPEHLSFTRLPLSDKERASRPEPKSPQNWQLQYSNVLRLCIWHQCQNGEPEAAALHVNFSNLCLVSKAIRYQARNIFFSKNKWVLHSSSSFDAIQWVLKHWGKEALCAMTDLRLEIQANPYFKVPFFQSLAKFVETVKEAHSLERLSVQWIASGPALAVASRWGHTWSPHVLPVCRDYGLERNSAGGRGRDNWEQDDGTLWEGPESEPTEWVEEEVILQPLQTLRGIGEARIEGTVSDAWAEYLEMAVSASRDAVVPEFEFQKKAREELQRLKNGIELKYGA